MEDFEQEQNNTSEEIEFPTILSEQTDEIEIEPEKPYVYKTNNWLFHVLAVFVSAFLGIFFLCQVYLTPIGVVGWSMLPNINASTISDSDTAHCDTVYYKQNSHYDYGDIVILSNEQKQYIQNDKVSFLIKRVIACPGDTITFYLTSIDISNQLYYYDIKVTSPSGKEIELDEDSYIKEPMYFDLTKMSSYTGFYSQIMPNIVNNLLLEDERKSSITISENCYFIMGDNRNNSSDSRYFGEVKYEDIRGNVRLHVKYGENIWIALFNKLRSYLSFNNYLYLKENL